VRGQIRFASDVDRIQTPEVVNKGRSSHGQIVRARNLERLQRLIRIATAKRKQGAQNRQLVILRVGVLGKTAGLIHRPAFERPRARPIRPKRTPSRTSRREPSTVREPRSRAGAPPRRFRHAPRTWRRLPGTSRTFPGRSSAAPGRSHAATAPAPGSAVRNERGPSPGGETPSLPSPVCPEPGPRVATFPLHRV